MKCTYCGMYLENVDEDSPNGMAHTIKCQTKRIHELENEKAAQHRRRNKVIDYKREERLECHEAEKQEMEAKLKDAVAWLEKNNTHLFALLRKLMYGHVYKCSTCGRFIGVGNANWDMDNMKPYCYKHLKQTTPIDTVKIAKQILTKPKGE